ncbi:MAG TPA: CBS domain-containing protein [Ktedonobacteraceae bacterium]|nr:CBS domain-containing protein [Ktedonobacteraceae bacterium]
MQVKDVMTTNVVTVNEGQSVKQAASLMARHHISGLPVVNDDGMVVGIVSEFDVIGKQGQQVKDIMTGGLISVTQDTDLEDVAHILVHQNIKRLPVLDQGKLVGIVSRGDLVREVATRWVCNVCGETTYSDTEPESCSRCAGVAVFASSDMVPPGS